MVCRGLHLVVAICFLARTILSSPCNSTDISPCNCSYHRSQSDDKINIDCSGQDLVSVPENLPSDLTVLDFSDNLISSGSLTTLCKYTHLEHLSIANNHINVIEPDEFSACEISQSINFTGNNLQSINGSILNGLQSTHSFHGLEANNYAEDAFSDLPLLTELEMITHQAHLPVSIFKNSKIQILKLKIPNVIRIPETLIDPLESTLTTFELDSRSLKALPDNFFSNLKVLQDVTLRLPDIQSLPSRVFDVDALSTVIKIVTLHDIKYLKSSIFQSLGVLRHLFIRGSIEMSSDLFRGLHNLEILDLRDITLHKLPDDWFRDLKHLRELTLRNARINDISRQNFESFDLLEIIDLSANSLRALNLELFHNISDTLKALNLSHNYLKDIPNKLFKINAALEILDLSENQISNIEATAFKMLPNLKWLYLQNNKINRLEPDTLAYNVNIQYLDLSSNILIDLPEGLFRNSQNLSVLKLSDNIFKNLERSINFTIPSLTVLDLSYNPIECDCSTVEVINQLTSVNIQGECESNKEKSLAEFVCPNASTSSETGYNTTLNLAEVTLQPLSTLNDVSSDSNKNVSLKTGEVSFYITLIPGNYSERITTESSDLTTNKQLTYNNSDISDKISDVSENSLSDVTSALYNATSDDTGTASSTFVDSNMSGDVNQNDVTPDTKFNSSGTSIKVNTNLNSVTANPHKLDSDEESEYFYLSLGSILSIAVISILILVCLYCKRRRSRMYEIPRPSMFDVGGESFSRHSYEDFRVTSNPSMTPLREVPSIQIESVDDDGNIQVELYPVSQTGSSANVECAEDNDHGTSV